MGEVVDLSAAPAVPKKRVFLQVSYHGTIDKGSGQNQQAEFFDIRKFRFFPRAIQIALYKNHITRGFNTAEDGRYKYRREFRKAKAQRDNNMTGDLIKGKRKLKGNWCLETCQQFFTAQIFLFKILSGTDGVGTS